MERQRRIRRRRCAAAFYAAARVAWDQQRRGDQCAYRRAANAVRAGGLSPGSDAPASLPRLHGSPRPRARVSPPRILYPPNRLTALALPRLAALALTRPLFCTNAPQTFNSPAGTARSRSSCPARRSAASPRCRGRCRRPSSLALWRRAASASGVASTRLASASALAAACGRRLTWSATSRARPRRLPRPRRRFPATSALAPARACPRRPLAWR